MDLVPVLATIVVIATLATLILGVLSYVAFRAREQRRPRHGGPDPGKRFLVRYTLPDEACELTPPPS
jgi:hypothetical protein